MSLNPRRVVPCLIVLFLGTPLHAQRNLNRNDVMQPWLVPPPIVNTFRQTPLLVEDEACLPWSLSQIRGATVSVTRLGVPGKAKSEYEKGCGAFKNKKLAEAEEHLRSAIAKYATYVAAWVLLGEVLSAEQHVVEAHEACSHAETTDPTYLPPYLCLAELDSRNGQWDEILNVTSMALGLNPVGDMYAYFYRSLANFHLNQLPEAETNGLKAEEIARAHPHAAIYYLLAMIYEAKGNAGAATDELKQYLKLTTDKQKVENAKQYLAMLESSSGR
jgi:tetratricopeptide (TPR) repeat protein